MWWKVSESVSCKGKLLLPSPCTLDFTFAGGRGRSLRSVWENHEETNTSYLQNLFDTSPESCQKTYQRIAQELNCVLFWITTNVCIFPAKAKNHSSHHHLHMIREFVWRMCSNQIDNNIHQGQLVLYRSSDESTTYLLWIRVKMLLLMNLRLDRKWLNQRNV